MFYIGHWFFTLDLVQLFVSTSIYEDNTDYVTLMMHNLKWFWHSLHSALGVIFTQTTIEYYGLENVGFLERTI